MSINIEDYIGNPIKRHIIGELMKHKKLKYSELMPEDVDNVLFNYHLQHLVKGGLVIKDDNYYTFSPEGWVTTSNITYDGIYFQKFVCRYKVYIISDGKILLHERQISPLQGDTTVIWGKLVYGESLLDRVTLRIKEKVGLEITPKLLGTVRTIIKSPQSDILDDSIYFICYATDFSGELKNTDENKNPLSWYELAEAVKLEEKNTGSGEKSLEVMKRFKNNNLEPFNFEEIITLESL